MDQGLGRTLRAALLATLLLAAPASADLRLDSTGTSQLRAAALPSRFQDQAAFNGLTYPTAVRFAPDGRVFVAEKSGLIKVFDSLDDPTASVYADLTTNVHDYWDRGMVGLALDPRFETRPYVYVLYTYNKRPGSSTVPAWPDACPDPPGAGKDGCDVTGRLSRLQAGSEQVLIEDFCQQYPSHTVGGLAFGPDGALYLGAGDGASFEFADYGQRINPCGDPPGGSMTAPTAEGGALRSQDLRTSADPAGLDGSILRVDPDTGNAVPTNPGFASPDANARRIIAYGFRNPFRITFRPGTNELWVGDVGYVRWEEINRIANPTGAVTNYGWPCYEGPDWETYYFGVDQGLNICTDLHAAGPGAVIAPYFSYRHGQAMMPGDTCPATSGSSTTGLAFYNGATFPDAYDGALFYSDYSRKCIFVMYRGANGLPDPSTRQGFASGVGAVDLQVGPGGDLYYVDMVGGTIRRIHYANDEPTARVTPTQTQGLPPLSVSFDGTESSDPDGDALTYAWDLDGDGQLDDSTAPNPSYTYTAGGTYTVRLRVSDQTGASGTTTVEIRVGAPPSARIDAPATTTRWAVGDTIAFSGSDSQALPPSAYTWRLTLQHCTSGGGCHGHPLQTFAGVTAGSFTAPDHGYPSHLELELTVRNADGLTDRETLRLDPRTVDLTFESSPPGLRLRVGTAEETAPFARRVIVGSLNDLGAPSPQGDWTFSSWSDGGRASHMIEAGAEPTTYRANYLGGIDDPTPTPTPSPTPTPTPTPRAGPPPAKKPSLTLRQAQRSAKSALRRRFGGRFTTRRAFKLSCKRSSAARVACRVSWVHRVRYRGTITVWATLERGRTTIHSRIAVRRGRY